MGSTPTRFRQVIFRGNLLFLAFCHFPLGPSGTKWGFETAVLGNIGNTRNSLSIGAIRQSETQAAIGIQSRNETTKY